MNVFYQADIESCINSNITPQCLLEKHIFCHFENGRYQVLFLANSYVQTNTFDLQNAREGTDNQIWQFQPNPLHCTRLCDSLYIL